MRTQRHSGPAGPLASEDQPPSPPSFSDRPRLRLPISKLGAVIPAHPIPGVIKKLGQALAPHSKLEG